MTDATTDIAFDPPGTIPITLVLGLPRAGESAVLRSLRLDPGDRTVYTVDPDGAVVEGGGGAGSGQRAFVLDASGLESPDDLLALVLANPVLTEQARIANLVTVIDVPGFREAYEGLVDRPDGDGTVERVPLAAVLVAQVEAADVVLLDGPRDIDPEVVRDVEGYVRNLNPTAEVRRTVGGAVDADWLLGTDRYGAEPVTIEPAAGADAFGFNTFVYAPGRPFRWAAFAAMLEEWPDEVMRSRGFAVFSDHPPVLLSMVRDTCELTVLDGAVLDGADTDDADHDHEADHDHGQEGDEPLEGTELVFIGRGMPTGEIIARFDACLAPEGEPAVL